MAVNEKDRQGRHFEIAKFIQQHPEEELAAGKPANGEGRGIVATHLDETVFVKTWTAQINQLHALYAAVEKTGLKKNDLMTAGSRTKLKPLLSSGTTRMIVETIDRELEAAEQE
jgi:hypothetical protein